MNTNEEMESNRRNLFSLIYLPLVLLLARQYVRPNDKTRRSFYATKKKAPRYALFHAVLLLGVLVNDASDSTSYFLGAAPSLTAGPSGSYPNSSINPSGTVPGFSNDPTASAVSSATNVPACTPDRYGLCRNSIRIGSC